MTAIFAEIFTLAQAFGWLGFILGVARYQFKTTRQVRFMNVLTTFAFFGHFYLLGAYVAASMAVLVGIRSALLLFSKLWSYKLTIAGSIWFASMVTTVMFFSNWLEIFCVLGTTAATIEDIQAKSKNMRFWAFLRQFFWFFHNGGIGAWGALANNVFVMVSNAIGYLRHEKPIKTGRF